MTHHASSKGTTMKFVHSALRVSSSEEASRFYEELLGFPLLREYEVKKELSTKLFGISRDSLIRLYDAGGGVSLEVFIDGKNEEPSPTLVHVCLEVEDRQALKKKAKEMGFRVVEAEREGTHDLVFIYDNDGNVFEIKPML